MLTNNFTALRSLRSCVPRARCLAGIVSCRSTVATYPQNQLRHQAHLSSRQAAPRPELHHCWPCRVSLLQTRELQQSLVKVKASAVTELSTAEEPAVTDVAGEPVLLDVEGMKCGGCSAAVKRILLSQPGVQAAAVNLLTESAVVQVEPSGRSSTVDLGKQYAKLLSDRGFPSKVRSSQQDFLAAADAAEAKKQADLQGSLLNLGFAWALVLICCAHHVGHLLHSLGLHHFAHTPLMAAFEDPVIGATLGAAALLGPGRKLLVDGAKALFNGHPDMNSLIGLGAATSFAAGCASLTLPGVGVEPSFLEEPVMLLGFVLLGRTLETRARLKASADLRSLAKLIPSQTRLVLDPGRPPKGPDAAPAVEVVSVATSSVWVGDVVRVLPGERVPVDGTVLDGRCSIDESMLTGESALVLKVADDQVTAGTVVYESPITVRAGATGSQSTLAGIGRLVSAAQAREAPLQRLADTVAGRFCYTVMAASAATFGFWFLAGAHVFPEAVEDGGGALALAVKLAVDVLVVACPCALGLATPTAVLVASSGAARRGLLLRGGGAVLEALAAVNCVVLDKTGTLTQGKLRLVEACAQGGASPEEVLRLAAGVEAGTRHPVADAVIAAARQSGAVPPQVQEFYSEAGLGAAGVVDGQRVAVGQLPWVLQQLGHTELQGAPSTSGNNTAGAQGQTRVHVAVQGRGVIGHLAFSDSLREDARDVVGELQRHGMRVMLLTGDNQEAASYYANQAGIQAGDAIGGASPSRKVEVLEQLRKQGLVVAMVGDGVNDAPALAAADVGVAMSSGMDAAGEAADVVLMSDRLSQVQQAVQLGRATLSKIKQNLGWALVYNVVGIPLAAGALLPSMEISLSPSVAGGMMAVSSLAVVSNSLLLRASMPPLPAANVEAERQAAQLAPAKLF